MQVSGIRLTFYMKNLFLFWLIGLPVTLASGLFLVLVSSVLSTLLTSTSRYLFGITILLIGYALIGGVPLSIIHTWMTAGRYADPQSVSRRSSVWYATLLGLIIAVFPFLIGFGDISFSIVPAAIVYGWLVARDGGTGHSA